MEFLGLLAIFFAFIFLIILAFTIFSAVRKRVRGVSKDYAEQIVMRRYVHGLVLGARFAREGSRMVWEFDVMDEGEIHRLSVDARTATIIKSTTVRSTGSYGSRVPPMLGKRAG